MTTVTAQDLQALRIHQKRVGAALETHHDDLAGVFQWILTIAGTDRREGVRRAAIHNARIVGHHAYRVDAGSDQ